MDNAALQEALEGERRLVEHWRRTRNSKLARNFKDGLSSFTCWGCDVDFEQMYGPDGRNVIQAHHREQLSARKGSTPTTIRDFDAVCANCHCIMHQREPPLKIAQLRDLISKQRNARV